MSNNSSTIINLHLINDKNIKYQVDLIGKTSDDCCKHILHEESWVGKWLQ